MPKYCSSCGATNQNNATVCSRCKKPLSARTPFGYPGTNRNPQFSQKPVSNTSNRTAKKIPKWIFGGIGAFGIFVIVLLVRSLAHSSAPSKDWIAENFPHELRTYRYEGEEYISYVDSVIINREYTNDDICIQDCAVCLADDNFTRMVYLHIETSKMDGHQFYLNSWSENENETFTCSQEWGKKGADAYIERNGYDLGEPEYSFNEDNTVVTASYSADADYTYLKVSGTAKYIGTIIGNVEIGEYPHSFYRDDRFDVSDVTCKWKLAGKWVGETDNDYRVELNIKKAADGFSWSGKAYYDKYTGGVGFYSDEGTLYNDTEVTSDICNPEKAEKSYVLTIGYPDFELIFMPEAAKIASSAGLFFFNEKTAQDLIKQ